MNKKHNPELTPRAKELRKSMTIHEHKLWHFFLKYYPIRFLRQKVIDQFIADFYCASAKLIIELDGGQHLDEKAITHDKMRTEVLEKYGLSVLRFSNDEIESNFKLVCNKISEEVSNRL
ncbi:MAG: endonuclease domain-containing protein [Oscillospiraceae bacterium]|nr:endonuclease domain-containing protein [Oscillospiraceae bacterium]